MTEKKEDSFDEAFLKAKKKFPIIPKNGCNPFYKSSAHPNGSPYSLYGDIIKSTLPALMAEGLYPQHTSRFSDGNYYVGTKLIHAPTQTQSLTFEMPIPVESPQKTMAGITYAKRGTLGALLGIDNETDDDGNAASPAPEPKYKADSSQMKKENHPMAKHPYTGAKSQKEELKALFIKHGIDGHEDMKNISEHAIKNKMTMEDIETYLVGGM